MKHLTHLAALCACLTSFPVSAHVQEVMNEPDSVYLFSYATVNDAGRSGLKLAWSTDATRWFSIGNGYGYVRCDYGAWGAEKRMLNPHLVRDEKGVWHCFWQLNESGKEWGHATSPDLMKWNPQTYYMQPARDGEQVPTVIRGSETRKKAVVEGVLEQGYVQKVAWEDVDRLLKFVDYRAYRDQLHNERTEQDAQRFAGLAPVSLQLTVRPEEAKPISDKLIGIFFEDINYGADGGLYAELVQNRDFEYSPKDNAHQGFDSGYAWSVWENGQSSAVKVATENPLHENNPHYVVLQAKPGMALRNPGFDGITLKKGENYYIEVFLVGAYQEILGDMHNLFGDTNAVHVSVTDKGYTIDQIIDGETVAEVLEYVQYEPKKLVRRLEIWVSKSIQSGKISLEEGKEFLNNYRSGLYGYTYLE